MNYATQIFTFIFITFFAACASSPAPKQAVAEVELEAADYDERLRMLVKDSSILNFFRFDDAGLRMYSDSLAWENDSVEYHIYPDEYAFLSMLSDQLSPDSLLSVCLKKGRNRWTPDFMSQAFVADTFKYGSNKLKPLAGLRVALDPGHLAHNMEMAEIEGKYVKMLPSKATEKKQIQFFEAAHNLATAHFLKEKLKALGADVMMTRNRLDDYPLGMSFFEWKKKYAEKGLEEALRKKYIDSTRAELISKGNVTPKQHFTWVYNQLDLRKRAEIINAYQPHLTVIIHYNITQAAWKDRTRLGFFPAAKDNFCMTFTPGSFMRNELARPIDRVSFARLLLTEDIDRSVSLSKEVCEAFHEKLKIPYVTAESPTTYIERSCIYAGAPGVYARNLTLSRLVASPLVYGESLCQEYPSEALALSRTPFEIAGIPTSERVAQVAEAYMTGILKWVRSSK